MTAPDLLHGSAYNLATAFGVATAILFGVYSWFITSGGTDNFRTWLNRSLAHRCKEAGLLFQQAINEKDSKKQLDDVVRALDQHRAANAWCAGRHRSLTFCGSAFMAMLLTDGMLWLVAIFGGPDWLKMLLACLWILALVFGGVCSWGLVVLVTKTGGPPKAAVTPAPDPTSAATFPQRQEDAPAQRLVDRVEKSPGSVRVRRK